MKNMKKLLSLSCAAALVFSLAACQKDSGNSGSTESTESTGSTESSQTGEYAGTTVIGKITAVKDSTVTVQLGELTESDNRPGMPDGSGDGNGQTPPEMPNGNGDRQTPPEKPDGDSNQSGQTPPEMPSGSGSGDGQTPPEKPDGDGSQNGQAPSGGNTPGGAPGSSKTFTAGDKTISVDLSGASIEKDSQKISVSDLSEGDILSIIFDGDGKAASASVVSLDSWNPGGNGGNGNFGGSDSVTQGDSANTISEDGTYKDMTYTSTGDDENALRIDGAAVTLDGITVDKSAGATSNTENGDFYGVNAALLATNGASVTIKNAKVTSSVQNGNGVFSYGSGTTVSISDSEITTTADNSGGIQTTGGGTTNASNLTVVTSGNSSAAIRSDRGGGTVNVNGGSYTSNGYNSPAIYSTATISVSDALLTANNSEALVIEGKNSITLENCTVVGNMSDTEGTSSSENVHNVMIYQSMSGDADVGTSSFSMTGGSLTSKNGDMFYVTNTHCILSLCNAELVNEDSDAYLLRVTGNSASRGWGTAGSNGAQVELTASEQTLEGNIIVDTISTLNMTLKNGSVFSGTVNITENEQNGTAVSDNAVITIESGCTWSLTGDCTVTSLKNNGTINFNGYTITLADGTVLK